MDIWNYILANHNEFIVNIIAGLVGAVIIAIFRWVVNRIKKSDKPVKLILIIASLIIIFLAALYREKVISYVTSQLRIISDNRGLFIAATIVGILTFILVLSIIHKIQSFVHKKSLRTPAASVSRTDTSDVEAKDVRITGQIPVSRADTSDVKAKDVGITEQIPDSWDEIIAAIDNGTAQQRYAVGAYKPLDLGRYGTVNMQLAGFDLDDRADGKGKAATTWIARGILPETHRWNPYWNDGKAGTGTVGGWEKCELRQWMNKRVRLAIPKDVRNRLVPVKKMQNSYDPEVAELIKQTTEDSVWIPSRDEVFGDQSLYYGLFRNQSDRRVKRRNGSAAWWWLRSASGTNYAYHVYSDGSYYVTYVDYTSGGVVLGFCL